MTKKTIILVALNLVFIFGLLLCNTVNFGIYKKQIMYYEISKIYYAPKSKIKILVNSKSYIDQNQDLGNGHAFVKLFVLNAKKDTVYLKTSPENIDFITFQKKRIPFECTQMLPNNLFDYLKQNGFRNIDKNEIAELRNAMTLLNYGPKATLLRSQTKYILVEK